MSNTVTSGDHLAKLLVWAGSGACLLTYFFDISSSSLGSTSFNISGFFSKWLYIAFLICVTAYSLYTVTEGIRSNFFVGISIILYLCATYTHSIFITEHIGNVVKPAFGYYLCWLSLVLISLGYFLYGKSEFVPLPDTGNITKVSILAFYLTLVSLSLYWYMWGYTYKTDLGWGQYDSTTRWWEFRGPASREAESVFFFATYIPMIYFLFRNEGYSTSKSRLFLGVGGAASLSIPFLVLITKDNHYSGIYLAFLPSETVSGTGESQKRHPELGIADELDKLSRLRNEGVISEEEFEALKGKLLGKQE
jgi:hypothetical protein